MALVKSSQPVHFVNGLSNKSYLSPDQRNQVEIINEQDYDLSDSDIDGHPTNRSLLSSQGKLESDAKKVGPSKAKDDNSLMQWLIQQFQQNEISRDPPTQSNVKSKDESGYFSPQSQMTIVDASQTCNGKSGHERWAKSCSRLDNVKPSNGIHYPRMQRSREASLQRSSKDTVDSVNNLFEEINRKAEDLKSDNERINQQLQKATAIISHLKYTQERANSQSRERSNSTPTGNYLRHEPDQAAGTPILKIKRLNNTKMNSAQSLLTRSAYQDSGTEDLDQSMSQISETKTLTVHRLRSENRFIMDDRLPQSPPSAWNGSHICLDGVRLRDTPPNKNYPMTRRYSSTQQTEEILVRDEYRESSLGPLNSYTPGNGGSNQPTNASGNSSKFSWLGRALSQLSLADWPGRSKMESKTTSKVTYSGTAHVTHENLSPQMNSPRTLSTMVRRPFRKKANSPSPGPVIISPPIINHQTAHGRCNSLVHLNGQSTPISIDEEEEMEQNLSRTCLEDVVQLRNEERKNNLSFIRKFSKELSVERMNRQDGLPSKDRSCSVNKTMVFSPTWKRELDVDSGQYTLHTGLKY